MSDMINYSRELLQDRCLTVFWIRFCDAQHQNKNLILGQGHLGDCRQISSLIIT